MAVFRVEKTRDFTVMSNHHLKNRSLSLKAKGLLSVILSLPDNWNYTTRGLASICKEGVDSIGGALKELEEAGYIVRNRLRDAKGRITDTEYVIHETPVQTRQIEQPDMAASYSDSPDTENPQIEQPDMAASYSDSPDTENPYMDEPDTETPAQLNTKESKTNPENTQPIKQSIYPSPVSQRERERCRARVEVQIDYDALLEDTSLNAAQLNEIVALMVETLCSGKETISVGGEEYPAEVVKSRLKKLNSEHIEYVLLCLKKTTTPIRNIHKYLLTSLYNAPLTMDSYMTAAFNHHYANRHHQAAGGSGR